MPASWVIEAVDVFEDCQLGGAAGGPGPLPQELGLDRFEEGLDRSVVVAIPGSTHRYPEAMLAQNLLIIVGTILATAIRMVDAALGWSPQRKGHVQRPDRQVAFHPVADSPADHSPGMQIKYDSQIEPTFTRPYIADVPRPFLVGLIRMGVAVQQVRRDVERMVAVGRHLVFLGAFDTDTILTHEPADAAVANVQTQLF